MKTNGCTTREWVLIRDRDAGTVSRCAVTGGTWTSAYDGLILNLPSQAQIDHVVPLKDAWFSGARNWPVKSPDFHAFANDMTRPQLLAVSVSSNTSKADKAPEEWMPSVQAVACTYVKAWVRVKSHWKLDVTQAEKDHLARELAPPCT